MQAYYAAQTAVKSGDKAAATKAYQEVLSIYKQISGSQLAHPHKEIAHKQVQTIYDSVTGMPQVTQLPKTPKTNILPTSPIVQPETPKKSRGFFGLQTKDFITLGFFAGLIMLVLFFKPVYIGLVAYEDTANTAPAWIGSVTELEMAVGTALPFDVSTSFRDVDGDELIYIATETDGLDVSVSSSIITFQARAAGEHVIILMATDLKEITKVPMTVRVT